MISIFLQYLSPYKYKFFLGFILLIIHSYFNILILDYMGMIISFLQDCNHTDNTSNILYIIGIIILFLITKFIIMFAARYFIIATARYIEFDIRDFLIKSIFNYPIYKFYKYKTGDIISRLISDIDIIRTFYGPCIFHILNCIITYFFVLYKIYGIFNILFLFLFIIIYIITCTIVFLVGNYLYKSSVKLQNSLDDLTSFTNQLLNSISTIKIFNREEQFYSNFNKKNYTYSNYSISNNNIISFLRSFLSFIVRFYLVLILIIFYIYESTINITSSDMIKYILYIELLNSPTLILGFVSSIFYKSYASYYRVIELCKYNKNKDVFTNSKLSKNIIQKVKGSVSIKNLSFKHSSESSYVFKNFNLNIKEGEKILIQGVIGSGKTTLLSILSGLYDNYDGDIIIGDYNIRDINKTILCNTLTYVPQANILFPDTLRYNINFSIDKDLSDNELDRYMEIIKLKDQIYIKKDKYDTLIGDSGHKLSGGQKRRLSIARAIIRDFNIILLDDSFANLDLNTTNTILNNIFKEYPNRTIIISSNIDLDKKYFDRKIILDNYLIS